MILQIDDWIFDVDTTRTMEYSAAEAAEHCDCAYCRNFYAAVDNTHPALRPFLAQFGLDVEAPEEMFNPSVFEKSLDYMPIYVVYGKILRSGQYEMAAGRVNIVARKAENGADYFLLDCYEVSMPWVLDEPIEEVISPANEPSFLQKMWKKLLSITGNNSLQS